MALRGRAGVWPLARRRRSPAPAAPCAGALAGRPPAPRPAPPAAAGRLGAAGSPCRRPDDARQASRERRARARVARRHGPRRVGPPRVAAGRGRSRPSPSTSRSYAAWIARNRGSARSPAESGWYCLASRRYARLDLVDATRPARCPRVRNGSPWKVIAAVGPVSRSARRPAPARTTAIASAAGAAVRVEQRAAGGSARAPAAPGPRGRPPGASASTDAAHGPRS